MTLFLILLLVTAAVSDDSQEQDPISYVPDVPPAETLEQAASARVNIVALASSLGDPTSRRQPPPPGGPARVSGRTQGARTPLYNNQEQSEVTFPSFAEAIANVKKAVRITSTTPRSASRSGRRRGRYRQTSQSASAQPTAQQRPSPTRGQPIAPTVPPGAQQVSLQQAPEAPLILAQQAGQRHAAALAAGRGRAPAQGIPPAVAQVLQEGGPAIPVSNRGASRFRGGSLDPGRFSGSGRGRGSSRSFPRAPSRGSNTGFSGRPSASRGGQGQGRGRARGRKQSIPSSIQISTPEDILALLKQTAPASASSSAGPAAMSQTSSAASQQVSPLAPLPSSSPVATSQAQPTADPRLQFVTADEAAAFAARLSANNGRQPEGVGQIPSPSAPTQPTVLLGSNIAKAGGSGALTRKNPSRRRGGYGGSAVYREGKSISGSKDQPTNPNHAKIFIVSPPRSSASRRGGNKKSSRGRTHSKFNLEAYLEEKRRQGEVLDISPTILSRQPSQIPTATVAPTSPRTPTAEQRPQRPQQGLQTALGPQAVGKSPLQSGQVQLLTQQPPNGFSGPPQVQQVARQGYPRSPAQALRPQIRQQTTRVRQKSQYARPVPTTPSTPRPTTARQVIQYAPKVSPTPGSRPRLTEQQLLQRQSARTPGPISYGSPPPRAGYDRQGPRPRRPTTPAPAASPAPPPSPVSPPSDVQLALQTESPDEEYSSRKPQERVRRPPSNREAVSSGARAPETFAKRGRKPKTSPKPDLRQQVESQVQRGVLQFTAQQQPLGQQTSRPPPQVLQQISEQHAVVQEEQAPQTQILGGVAPVIGPQTASQLQVIGQGLISQAGAAAQTAIRQEQSISQSGVARLQDGAQPEAPIQQATDQGESVNIQTAARAVSSTSAPPSPQVQQSQQYEDTQPTSTQHLEATNQRRNQNAPVEQVNSNQQRSNGVGLSRQDLNERLQDQRLRNEAVVQQQLLQQQLLVQQLLQQQEPQSQPQRSDPDPRTVKQRSGSRGSRRFSAGQFNTALEQYGDAPFEANQQQYSPRISAKSAYESSIGSIPVTERASTAGVTARNAATVSASIYAPRTALPSREPPVAIYTPSTGTTVHITSSPQPSPPQTALPPPAPPSATPQGTANPFPDAIPPPVDIPAPAPPSAAPPPRASTPPPRASTPPPVAVPPPAPTTPAPPPTPPPTKYSDRFRNRYSARKLANIEAGFDKVRRGRKLSDRALLDKELEMVEVSMVENLPQERRSVGATRRFTGRRRNASVRRGSDGSENISSRRGFGIRRGAKPTKLPGHQNTNHGSAPSSSELRKVDENDQELDRAASKPLVRRVVVRRRGEQQRRRNQPSNDNRARVGQGRGEARKRMEKEQRKRLEYASNLEDVPWELAHLLSPEILPYRRDEMESPSLITQLSILESVMKSVKEQGGRTGRLFIPDGSKSITQSLQSQSPSRNLSRIQYLPEANDQVSTKLSRQEYLPQSDQTPPRKKLSYLPEPSRGSSLSSSNRGYLPEPGERPPNTKESPLSEQSTRRTSKISEGRGYLPLSGFIELPQGKEDSSNAGYLPEPGALFPPPSSSFGGLSPPALKPPVVGSDHEGSDGSCSSEPARIHLQISYMSPCDDDNDCPARQACFKMDVPCQEGAPGHSASVCLPEMRAGAPCTRHAQCVSNNCLQEMCQ